HERTLVLAAQVERHLAGEHGLLVVVVSGPDGDLAGAELEVGAQLGRAHVRPVLARLAAHESALEILGEGAGLAHLQRWLCGLGVGVPVEGIALDHVCHVRTPAVSRYSTISSPSPLGRWIAPRTRMAPAWTQASYTALTLAALPPSTSICNP